MDKQAVEKLILQTDTITKLDLQLHRNIQRGETKPMGIWVKIKQGALVAHAEFSHREVELQGVKEDGSTTSLGMKLLVHHFTQLRHTTQTVAIPLAVPLGENHFH